MTDTCKGNKQAIKLVYSGKNTMKMKTKPLKNWATKKTLQAVILLLKGVSYN